MVVLELPINGSLMQVLDLVTSAKVASLDLFEVPGKKELSS